MYEQIKLIANNLREEDIEGDEYIFNDFINCIKHFDNTLYPATEIYRVVAGEDWGTTRNYAKYWRKIILCTVSTCKVIEKLIREKLPMLQEQTKGIMNDIYGIYSIILRSPKEDM